MRLGIVHRVALAALLVPVGSIAARAATPDGPPPAFAPALRTATLKNDLRVILAPDTAAAGVEVAVWYGVGLDREPAGKNGIQYLFSRLMFRGSKRYPAGEHQKLVQAEGGSVNATSTVDGLSFYQVIPPSALALALDLEADRMAAITLTPAAVDNERETVRDERRSRIDRSPVGRGLQELYGIAFRGHAYARPVIGADQDLARITLADAQAFDREQITPPNAVLVIAGRFDAEDALGMVRKKFESIPRGPSPRRVAATPLPAPSAGRTSFVAPTGGPVLLVGWRAPDDPAFDRDALELLERVANRPDGRLAQALKPHALDIVRTQLDFDRRRDASLLSLIVTLHAGVDTAAIESAATAAVEGLATELVSAEDVVSAVRQLEAETWFALQTVHGRAQAIGTGQILDGDPLATWRRIEHLRRLTPIDLRRAAAETLLPEHRSVVWESAAPGAGGNGTAKP